jgi:hypothetical protein
MLEIGQAVYYRGLNYVLKTTIFDIQGEIIHLNNGVKRTKEAIGKEIFLDKESANSTLHDVYMAGYARD